MKISMNEIKIAMGLLLINQGSRMISEELDSNTPKTRRIKRANRSKKKVK